MICAPALERQCRNNTSATPQNVDDVRRRAQSTASWGIQWVYHATALSDLGEVGAGVGVVNGIWDEGRMGQGGGLWGRGNRR